jgi:pimeloyl-ACP methyl ester carboxylesterase
MDNATLPLRISKCELVDFFTKDSIWLQGLLLRAGHKHRVAVIYIHGIDSNFYRSHLPIFIFDWIKCDGISIFITNNRGHDPITLLRDKTGKSVLGGGNIEKFEDSVNDIDGAIDRLRGLGYRKFILMAHSGGSQKVVYYLKKRKREDLIGTVFISPPNDYEIFKKTLGSRYGAAIKKARSIVGSKAENKPSTEFLHCKSARRFLSLSDPNNFEARVFSIKNGLKEFSELKTKMLILIGGDDEYEKDPKEFCRKLRKANENANIKIIKGANHSFIGHENAAAKAIAIWLKHNINL